MPLELPTHALLRIRGAEALIHEGHPPEWVRQSLQRAPWVVVRRAPYHDSTVPVGVRGDSHRERFGSWVSDRDILESVTPCTLASRRAWVSSTRYATIPALAALDSVEAIMRAHGLEGAWGPTGSVGFELATGCATAMASSDLDLAVHLDHLLSLPVARSLHDALSGSPVRTDVLLERRQGAVALSEYVRMPRSFVLRTTEGPRLLSEA